MVICRNCGSSLPNTASFCGMCGGVITQADPALPVTLHQSDIPTKPALPAVLERPVSWQNPFDHPYFPPSTSTVQKSIHIFISYAKRDQNLRDQLENHLSNLKYRGLITTWTAKEISASEEIIQQIDVHLNTAHIILLLISANYLASKYCYSREMLQAVQRHERDEVNVIPVLLRPVVFTDAPFARLQPLPTNGKPVVNWRNRDSAFVDIAIGIERVVQKRLTPISIPAAYTPGTWSWKAYDPYNLQTQQPQGQSPTNALLGSPLGSPRRTPLRRQRSLILVGLSLLGLLSADILLVRYPNLIPFVGIIVVSLILFAGILLAVRALMKSIQSRAARKRREEEARRRVLEEARRREQEEVRRQEQERAYYEKALKAYEQALEQNNADATAYRGKGNALAGLERYGEALTAFERSVALTPLPDAYASMGNVLTTLERYDEAVAAYEQAITLHASYALAYFGMSKALLQIGRVQEAEQSYEQAKRLDGDD